MRNFLFLCFLLMSFDAVAKRDFTVFGELRCGRNSCYERETGALFNGVARSYYQNGVVKSNIEYNDGLKDGAARYYYDNGHERRQEFYIKGVLNGRVTEYYDDGNIKFEIEYDGGKKNGVYRSYYEGGVLKVEEKYNDGKIDGRAHKYNARGKVIREAVYNEGVLVDGACFGPNGKDRRTFTYEMIEAYNKRKIVPCDI